MEKIIVTPAGRKKYLEILYLYLLKQKNDFDKWHLWVNTSDIDDICYMEKLKKENSWISCVYLDNLSTQTIENRLYTSNNIYKFIIKDMNNPEALYLRLDDDIIFIEQGAIKKMFDQRINNGKSILIYGNIINNKVIQYNHQKMGKYKDFLKFDNCCVTDENIQFPKDIHTFFIEKYYNSELHYFYVKTYFEKQYNRTSINAIAQRGDMYKLYKNIHSGEEDFLSTELPIKIKFPNCVIGDAIFVHFSFFPQEKELLKTNILEEYRKISQIEFNK